ncbi:hypothetical protein [Roseibium sp. SCP14]|uniref:hypothetical protein n=1 Tax=Roseibium sp. SCP14 TaxID=3141375 RepID=UPI00333D3F96
MFEKRIQKSRLRAFNVKPYVLSIFLLTTATNSALAEGKVTHPLPGDPLIDFRIDNCDATRGFASIRYATDKGPIVALSDLCIDEEKGTITSVETREGFTLVEKSRHGKTFEVIDSDEVQGLRTKVQLIESECVVDDPDDVFTTNHFFASKDKFRIPSDYGANMLGYTIPSFSNKPKKSAEEAVPMTLIYASQTHLPQKTTEKLLGVGGQFRGQLSVSGNSGVFTITEGAGVTVGDAGGTIKLKFRENGEVMMSGQLTAKNQRLAGHEPGEWITMTAEIPYMRGHLLGAEGDQIYGFGIADGSFVDTEGHTHQFRAQVRFETCLF